ncbi:MAG: GatB/YqeY domain-containing protein [Muribaculaceae bacterium]|nr:GatB/YqeY domain-containing protein [Muribaculaceae bacterium]
MLHTEINHHIAQAMKAKDKNRLYVLKMIKAKFLEFQTSKGYNEEDFNEAKEIAILQKMEKTWADELQSFRDAGRDVTELAEQVQILQGFLPKEPTADEIIAAIRESGFAPEMKNMRNILAFVQQRYPAASGKLVSDAIRSLA